MADFNTRPEYEEYVEKHVRAALLACDKYRIPVFMTFAVANGRDAKDGGTEYVTEMLSAAVEGVSLEDDRLVRHALVADGHDVAPFRALPSVEEELEHVGADAPTEDAAHGAAPEDAGVGDDADDDPFAAFDSIAPAKAGGGEA